MSDVSADHPGAPAAGRLVESARQSVLGYLDALRGEIDAMLGGHDDSRALATMRASFAASADGIDAALADLLGVLGRPAELPAEAGIAADEDPGRHDQIGLAQLYRQLTATLEGLEVGLDPSLSGSGDVARASYVRSKQSWDRHLTSLATVLNQIGSTAVSAGPVPASA